MMETNKKTYFISDLHLLPTQSLLGDNFLSFLDDIQDKAEALYILGDLFEFWIGDDIINKEAGKPYLPFLEKLKVLSKLGIKIYFTQGNRDFLAQKRFVRAIGAELLPDSKVIDLYGTLTLIMHGDTLCTDDESYQRMRRIFRNKIVQWIYTSLNAERRSRIAGNTRKALKEKVPKKSYKIVDVNQTEVERVMKEAGVLQLIHGHTHRPATHEFKLNGKKAKRIVLSDWIDEACYLSTIDGESFEVLNKSNR